MRIAIVLSGQARFADLGAAKLKSDLPGGDFFFHTWTDETVKNYAEWIDPTKIEITPVNKLIKNLNPIAYTVTSAQKVFTESQRRLTVKYPQLLTLFHMFHSMKTADALRIQHEEEGNFKYDMVIRSRFDFLPLSNLEIRNFSEFELFTPDLLKHSKVPCDWLMISSSDVMTRVCNLHYSLFEYVSEVDEVAGENLVSLHLQKSGIFNVKFHMSGVLIRDRRLKDLRFGKISLGHNPKLFMRKKTTLFLDISKVKLFKLLEKNFVVKKIRRIIHN
jgi:hypothetical protein